MQVYPGLEWTATYIYGFETRKCMAVLFGRIGPCIVLYLYAARLRRHIVPLTELNFVSDLGAENPPVDLSASPKPR